MNDDALAEWLQPQLKRSGPAPNTMHIKAAIMVARDGVGARAACRAVPGLSETINGSVVVSASWLSEYECFFSMTHRTFHRRRRRHSSSRRSCRSRRSHSHHQCLCGYVYVMYVH